MYIKSIITEKGSTLNGPVIIEPRVFRDERGFFFESWNKDEFNNKVSKNVSFVQDNFSFSSKGVLRGLHYQKLPIPQGKLVRCAMGNIFDVIVDIRLNSETFGSWSGVELSAENFNQLWIPEGFAHGFLVMSESAIVEYKTTNFWNKDLEKSIIWNDFDIAINWPLNSLGLKNPKLSKKDLNAPNFKEAELNGDIF